MVQLGRTGTFLEKRSDSAQSTFEGRRRSSLTDRDNGGQKCAIPFSKTCFPPFFSSVDCHLCERLGKESKMIRGILLDWHNLIDFYTVFQLVS